MLETIWAQVKYKIVIDGRTKSFNIYFSVDCGRICLDQQDITCRVRARGAKKFARNILGEILKENFVIFPTPVKIFKEESEIFEKLVREGKLV